MQIVIDIPEDVYTRLFDNGIQDNEIAVDDVCEMAKALRLGTPLPKGHGKIIDVNNLMEEMKATRTYDIPFALERIKPIIEAECTYKETGCGSCKSQLDCPIETEGSDSE